MNHGQTVPTMSDQSPTSSPVSEEKQENATVSEQKQQENATVSEQKENTTVSEQKQQENATVSEEQQQENATVSEQKEQENTTVSEQKQQESPTVSEQQENATVSEQQENTTVSEQKQQENAPVSEQKQESPTVSEQKQERPTVSEQTQQENTTVSEQKQQENAPVSEEKQQENTTVSEQQENAPVSEQTQQENTTVSEQQENTTVSEQKQQENAPVSEQKQQESPTPSVRNESAETNRIAAEFSSVCHVYFSQHCAAERREIFERMTLPFILQLTAVDLSAWDASVLTKGVDAEINVPRADAAVLFAAGFVGKTVRHSFNFKSLHNTMKGGLHITIAKFDCFFHYFEVLRNRVLEVQSKNPTQESIYELLRLAIPEYLCFRRQTIASRGNEFWKSCETPLCKFSVTETGRIEDDAEEMLQIDFANKYIGGGVLTHGCVQEEIRFCINPEYIVSMFFVEGYMTHDESISILGAERFCNYAGYRETFQFAGPYHDKIGSIEYAGRNYLNVSLSAIDALPGLTLKSQFSEEIILRELNKAHAGFSILPWEQEAKPLATGNWGCGVFGGNIQLKSLIQWMAASVANRREVLYFSFHDQGAAGLEQVCAEILDAGWTVKDLWKAITTFDPENWKTCTLFDSILIALGKKSNTTGRGGSALRKSGDQPRSSGSKCILS